MAFRATALRRGGLLVLTLGLAAAPLLAQVANSPIVFAQSAITTSFVNAPQLGSTSSGGSGSDLQWLKVEFHYGVNPSPSKFLDSAKFRIWIEGRDLFAPEATTKDGIAVAMTGEVTYVNLPMSKDQFGVFFIPPATLARFSTGRGSSDFDRTFNIHIEAYVADTKVDYFDKNKETDASWFQQLKPLSGYVYRQDQCVFMVSDPDRYPPIKIPSVSVQ